MTTKGRALKLTAIAALSWIAFETVLWFSHYGDLHDIADYGPNTGQDANLLLHWPGLMTAQSMHLSSWSPGYIVVSESVTLVQMLLLFWVGRTLWKRITLAPKSLA